MFVYAAFTRSNCHPDRSADRVGRPVAPTVGSCERSADLVGRIKCGVNTIQPVDSTMALDYRSFT